MENPPSVPPNLPQQPQQVHIIYQQNPYQPKRTSAMAVISLILGILCIFGGALTFILPLLAVIFGHMALNACANDPQLQGRGQAKFGLIIGWICIGGWGLFIMILLGGATR